MKARLFTATAALVLTAAAHAEEALVMRSLFNGTDLTGWKGAGYAVEDGAITCTPKGRVLQTEEIFSNFVLDFEFQLTPGANNGLGICYPGTGDSAYTGMELQILDSTHPKYKDLKPYQFHASLYTMAPAKQGALKPVGEWNHERVSLIGSALKVEVNGQIVLRADLDDMAKLHPQHQGVKRRSGHIAFLGHGDKVSFRNIRIGELPPVANEAGAKAAGFTQIFDGKSLDGWKHDDEITNWTAANGILKHNGKPGPTKDLWSEKAYKDFTLVFDWRWSGRGPMQDRPNVLPDGSESGSTKVEELDSGVYLRGSSKSQVNLWNWTVGSGEVYGYRTDKSQPAEVRAAVTPKEKADKPLGEWNRTMITLQDDKLTVTLNGKVVIENAALPGIPAEGPIAFQHHHAPIDFANVWIKEL